MTTNKALVVNGHPVRIAEYSRKKFIELQELADEQDKYIADNPGILISEIPLDLRADWLKRKADILWSTDKPYPKGFFESDDFELSKLKDSQDFFLKYTLFL